MVLPKNSHSYSERHFLPSMEAQFKVAEKFVAGIGLAIDRIKLELIIT